MRVKIRKEQRRLNGGGEKSQKRKKNHKMCTNRKKYQMCGKNH